MSFDIRMQVRGKHYVLDGRVSIVLILLCVVRAAELCADQAEMNHVTDSSVLPAGHRRVQGLCPVGGER